MKKAFDVFQVIIRTIKVISPDHKSEFSKSRSPSPDLLIINPSFSDPPQVQLKLGTTLNPDDIKEGDDVYFECNIRANPKEHKITWYHDVSKFEQSKL